MKKQPVAGLELAINRFKPIERSLHALRVGARLVADWAVVNSSHSL